MFSIQGHVSKQLLISSNFWNFFVLILGEVSVQQVLTGLQWVDAHREVRGTVWFSGCFSFSACMVYPVTITLVSRKGGEENVLAGVTIMPDLEGFPVNGLLKSTSEHVSPESGYELGIRVNCKGNKRKSDNDYYITLGKYLLWLVWIRRSTGEAGFPV